ncbi:MAG: transposase, partial [Weeksellaceae bacterium]|nr:transposase [Weeksellaceae bacterium]
QNAERVNQNKDYYKQRQQLAEHPWGTIKRQRGFDHVLTRGKTKVLGEASLVFIGYNLTRCANITNGFERFKLLINSYIDAFCRVFMHQKARFKPYYNIEISIPAFLSQ